MRHELFEAAVLPHLDAGFNLARWMTGNEALAHDAVQIAAERALKRIASLRGEDGRPWFLGIVRNTCIDALREQSRRGGDVDVTALLEGPDELEALGGSAGGPGDDPARRETREKVNATLRALPFVFREVLVLREMEDMSYEGIATVTGAPIGTVMSRLARARKQFRAAFGPQNETGETGLS